MNVEKASGKIILFSKMNKKTLNNMSIRGYQYFKKNFEINISIKKFYKILENEKI